MLLSLPPPPPPSVSVTKSTERSSIFVITHETRMHETLRPEPRVPPSIGPGLQVVSSSLSSVRILFFNMNTSFETHGEWHRRMAHCRHAFKMDFGARTLFLTSWLPRISRWAREFTSPATIAPASSNSRSSKSCRVFPRDAPTRRAAGTPLGTHRDPVPSFPRESPRFSPPIPS